MSRPRGQLQLYRACDPRRPSEIRLLVARTFAQADSMVPAGWETKICGTFQAYRLGLLGVKLEYYWPTGSSVEPAAAATSEKP